MAGALPGRPPLQERRPRTLSSRGLALLARRPRSRPCQLLRGRLLAVGPPSKPPRQAPPDPFQDKILGEIAALRAWIAARLIGLLKRKELSGPDGHLGEFDETNSRWDFQAGAVAVKVRESSLGERICQSRRG